MMAQAAFAAKVDVLTQFLWDPNCQEHVLHSKWQDALAARRALVQTWGIASASPAAIGAQGAHTQYARGRPTPGPAPAGGANGEDGINWKGWLDQAFAQSRHVTSSFTYAAMDVVDARGPDMGPFVAQVSSPALATVYQGEPARTKKLAEQLAAKEAMACEFPAEFQSVSAGIPLPKSQKKQAQGANTTPPLPFGLPPLGQPQAGAQFGFGPMGPGQSNFGAAGQNKKRRRNGDSAQASLNHAQDPKTRFQDAAQLLIGRSLTKGDIVYTTEQLQDGSNAYHSAVTLLALDPNRAHQGVPCLTPKLAEISACEAFLCSEFALDIESLSIEHKARKAIKEREYDDARKAKQALKAM